VRRVWGIGKLTAVTNMQLEAIVNSNKSVKKAPLADATLNDPRWTAVKARSIEADGKFYYGVQTTGVYCRPSCAARPARPENVRFYGTREEAEQAGFRPCKRRWPSNIQPGLPRPAASSRERRIPRPSTSLPGKWA
jgi:hypothetical protein